MKLLFHLDAPQVGDPVYVGKHELGTFVYSPILATISSVSEVRSTKYAKSYVCVEVSIGIVSHVKIPWRVLKNNQKEYKKTGYHCNPFE